MSFGYRITLIVLNSMEIHCDEFLKFLEKYRFLQYFFQKWKKWWNFSNFKPWVDWIKIYIVQYWSKWCHITSVWSFDNVEDFNRSDYAYLTPIQFKSWTNFFYPTFYITPSFKETWPYLSGILRICSHFRKISVGNIFVSARDTHTIK